MRPVHVDPDVGDRPWCVGRGNDAVATPHERVDVPKAAERHTLAAIGSHAPEPAVEANRHQPAIGEFGGSEQWKSIGDLMPVRRILGGHDPDVRDVRGDRRDRQVTVGRGIERSVVRAQLVGHASGFSSGECHSPELQLRGEVVLRVRHEQVLAAGDPHRPAEGVRTREQLPHRAVLD
jgi:hypothetical protein